MSHQWHKGALSKSSWHQLETIIAMESAEDLIRAGETTNAYPVYLHNYATQVQLPSGIVIPGAARAIVGTYADGTSVALGSVGDRYEACTPTQWRDLIRAAVEAGAQPTGAFALRGGTRVLATFEVGKDTDAGMVSHLSLVDDFTGSLHLQALNSSIRIVCANTLAMAQSEVGKGAKQVKLRHSGDMQAKTEDLAKAIAAATANGVKLADAYKDARETRITRDDVDAILAELFQAPEAEGRKRSRAVNKRNEVIQAMARVENNEGETLATLWNGLTWTLDRDAAGAPKSARGGADMLDSMLLGTRRDFNEAITHRMLVVLDRDGKEHTVPAGSPMAIEAEATVGRSLLSDMLG